MINQVQKLNFELMKIASFNSFNGEKVVDSLTDHQELWDGAVMDSGSYCFSSSHSSREIIDLVKLRDISNGYWNVSTLYITAKPGRESELRQLAKTWGADEVDWMDEPDLGTNRPPKVLRVWWD